MYGIRQLPPTAGTSESTSTSTESTAPAWPGYVDHKTEYTYFHTETREKQWEEDIVYMANTLMKNHLLLRNRAFLVEMPNYQSDSANFYDEELKNAFVAAVNELIPELASLTDRQIYYRLHKIMGLFQDVHTRMEYYSEEYFPIMFMNFYEYGKTVFYAVALDQTHEEALYGRLEAVNGYSVEEVTEMIAPYTMMETSYGMADWMGKAGLGASMLSDVWMLEAAGVIGEGEHTATYTLTGQDGTVHTLTRTQTPMRSTGWASGIWRYTTFRLRCMASKITGLLRT